MLVHATQITILHMLSSLSLFFSLWPGGLEARHQIAKQNSREGKYGLENGLSLYQFSIFGLVVFLNFIPIMRSYVKCVSTGSFFMPVKAPLNSFTHCYAELRFCRSFERLSEQRAPFRRMQHPWTDPSSPCVTEI